MQLAERKTRIRDDAPLSDQNAPGGPRAPRPGGGSGDSPGRACDGSGSTRFGQQLVRPRSGPGGPGPMCAAVPAVFGPGSRSGPRTLPRRKRRRGNRPGAGGAGAFHATRVAGAGGLSH